MTTEANIPPTGKTHWAVSIPAKIITYVFHPVFIPTVLTFVLYQLMPASFAGFNDEKILRLLASIAYITLFFPLLTLLLSKALGFISSIHVHTSKDRIIPMIATMIFYFWAYHVAKNSDFPFILRVMLLGSYWIVIGIFMVNIFYKISIHTSGAGGVVGMFGILLFTSPVNMIYPFFISLFVAGLIGTARLALRAHAPGQIWLGYFLGAALQVGAYFYLY